MILLVCLVGLASAAIGSLVIALDIWSRTWQKVKAQIVDVAVFRVGSGKISSNEIYKPWIEYHYSIRNVSYNSKRLTVLDDIYFSSIAEANSFCENYRKGDFFDVAVCPLSPSYSLLFPGHSKKIIGITLLFIGILLAGTSILFGHF